MAKGPEVTVQKDYLDNLEKKVADLATLIEVSSILSSTLDFNELIRIVMEKAKKVMDAEACSILLYNKKTNKLEFSVALGPNEPVAEMLEKKVSLELGQGIVGWAAEHLKPLVVKDAQTDDRFNKEVDRSTGFTTRSLIAAPLIGRSGLIGVAEILNPINKDAFDDYDAEIFQTHCRQVAVAIENAKFHKDSIEREKFRLEMDIASEVQKSFLPEMPSLERDNIKITAVNLSASQVGGDVYDFIEHQSGRVGVLIGDVSGKGVSAALYMAKIISEFRNVAHMADSPEEALHRLNLRLSSAPRGMFVTCVYLMADPVTGVLSVSVAGHPPFLKTSKGKAEVVNLPSGPPVGILQTEFPVTDIKLEKGERIFLLTDGVFDAKNKEGKRIGFEKISEYVNENADKENLIHMLVEYVNDYSKDTDRADDLTIVEIRMSSIVKDLKVIKIPSHPKYLRSIRVLTDEMTGLYGLKEKEAKNIRLAVDEACSNVIKHAYKMETDHEIIVKFKLSPKEFEVIIEDDGIKAKPEQIKGRNLDDLKPGGLGVHFINRAFDVVLLDEKKKNGNRLKLIKYSSDKKQDAVLKGAKS